MNIGDVSSHSSIAAGDNRSTVIDTRLADDLYETWDATWRAMSCETPHPLADTRQSAQLKDEHQLTQRSAAVAPRSAADVPGPGESTAARVESTAGNAESICRGGEGHARMFVSAEVPALPHGSLSAPREFQASATEAPAIMRSSVERDETVDEVTRDIQGWSPRAAEEPAPESVTILTEDGAISIVVRDTTISDRRALESALAVASELRGTASALRRLTLNGQIIYQLDADTTVDRRRDPAVLFSC